MFNKVNGDAYVRKRTMVNIDIVQKIVIMPEPISRSMATRKTGLRPTPSPMCAVTVVKAPAKKMAGSSISSRLVLHTIGSTDSR